jgi:hypothetical protein
MSPNAHEKALRITAFVAASFAALIALHELSVTRQYSAYQSLTGMFRERKAVSEQAISHYAGRLDGELGSCRTDILDAVVAVSQRNVDQEFSTRNRPGWLAAMQKMEETVRSALACRPANGDLWVRLATLRWFLGGSADEQISFMTLSQAYAPANLATTMKRLRYWSQVTPYMAALGEDLIRSDVRTMLLHAPEKDVVSSLSDLPENLLPLIRSEQAIVPQSRLDALAKAGVVGLQRPAL